LSSEDIEKKIEMFRKAIVPERIEFKQAKIEKILLAVDIHSYAFESNKSAVLLTSYLARRFKAKVYVVCVATTTEEIKKSDSTVFKAVELLDSQGIIVEGSCDEGYPSENILRLADREKPSVIIIPTPYAEKSEKPSIESLGTTVDIVLKRAPCPTILVKATVQKPENIMKVILLPINSVEEYTAAEWALTLVDYDSKIVLLNVVDKSSVKNTKEIAEELLEAKLDEDSIEGLIRKNVDILMGSISRRGHEESIRIERKFRSGDMTSVTLEEIQKEKSTILILSTKPETGNTIGSKVENIARLSSVPVLIVK
jgi:nucleotide-binding universal stress UspA family protein